tara:strand:- start:1811 stop:3106 length:1296 start_codon:yes stop_codon:yes gene_type:complete
MALVLNDRVKETTTTTGTGTLTLGGAVTGFETFAAGIGNSNTTYYAVILPGSAEFEVGLGTLSSDSSTIARTTIISSSNSDSAVNFSAGTKNIFCTIPASKSVFLDASGNVSVGADLSVGDDLTIEGGLIDLRSNSGSASQIKFYCEVSNAHAQTLTAQPHSAAAANTLRLPNSGDSGTQDLVAVDTTQTLTNKTLTTPVIAEITNGSSITLNAASDITLDAGGANVLFKDDGTEILDIGNSSGDVSLRVSTADKNFQIKGTDGSSAITALDIDMADAGAATFNNKIIATELDISGDADIDGTLEADAMTLNGTAITTTATLSTGISNGNVLVATSGVADNDFLKVDGTSIEGRSASEVLSDIGGQASLTFGISNTNAVKIDSSSVADDEFARFTANGLESRSASEVLSDIGATTASAAADEATALAIALG